MDDDADWQKQNSAKAIEFARDAIRSGILINGGAAVAVLALLSGQGASVSLNFDMVKFALWYFAAGVLAAFVASIIAYLAQTFYAMHNAGQIKSKVPAWIATGVAVLLVAFCGYLFYQGTLSAAEGVSAERAVDCSQREVTPIL